MKPKETSLHHHKERTEVFVLRDWKEYIGESMLIVFSVLLALFLTEFINNIHEKNETHELMENIKDELATNLQHEKAQYIYETGVLNRIDSALHNTNYMQTLLINNEFQWKTLMPDGILYGDLNTVAWDVAMSHNITTRINFKIIAQLTDIYNQQARIDKLEDKAGAVLLDFSSRRPENLRTTLILLRDNYKGWAYDRAPSLIKKYEDALKMLEGEGY